MEKSHSRPLTKRVPPVSNEPFNLNVVVRQRGTSAKRNNKHPDKITREDISRCITIWASMYLTPDETSGTRDLCLPSRPWPERDPSSVKRFE